ncbi:MAG: hypothetical protein LQ345_005796, partial [Seirophora villosa]
MLFSYLIIGLSQLICIRATPLAAQDQFPSNMVLTAPGKKDYTSTSNAFEVTCDGDVYGHDLRYESCAQLLKDKDGRLTGPQTFGRRESPAGRQATYPTPWRWSSADGLCVLDVFQTSQVLISENIATLQAVMEIMLRQCVLGGKGQGSFATGFGRYSQLILTISSYKPQVTCRGAISRVGDAASSFHALARVLPASVTERVFGVDVKLPWQQTGPSTTPGRRPLSVVLQTSPFAAAYRDTAAWWDAYAAVAAIWAICGEAGKGGLAEDI